MSRIAASRSISYQFSTNHRSSKRRERVGAASDIGMEHVTGPQASPASRSLTAIMWAKLVKGPPGVSRCYRLSGHHAQTASNGTAPSRASRSDGSGIAPAAAAEAVSGTGRSRDLYTGSNDRNASLTPQSRPLYAAALSKGRPSSISRLMRCTVPLPTPHSAATFRMPLPARN